MVQYSGKKARVKNTMLSAEALAHNKAAAEATVAIAGGHQAALETTAAMATTPPASVNTILTGLGDESGQIISLSRSMGLLVKENLVMKTHNAKLADAVGRMEALITSRIAEAVNTWDENL